MEKRGTVPGGRGWGDLSPRNPHRRHFAFSISRNKSMATTTAGSSAQASSSSVPVSASTPILATGDWTKNLVHLAKTAELKSVPFLTSYPAQYHMLTCVL